MSAASPRTPAPGSGSTLLSSGCTGPHNHDSAAAQGPRGPSSEREASPAVPTAAPASTACPGSAAPGLAAARLPFIFGGQPRCTAVAPERSREQQSSSTLAQLAPTAAPASAACPGSAAPGLAAARLPSIFGGQPRCTAVAPERLTDDQRPVSTHKRKRLRFTTLWPSSHTRTLVFAVLSGGAAEAQRELREQYKPNQITSKIQELRRQNMLPSAPERTDSVFSPEHTEIIINVVTEWDGTTTLLADLCSKLGQSTYTCQQYQSKIQELRRQERLPPPIGRGVWSLSQTNAVLTQRQIANRANRDHLRQLRRQLKALHARGIINVSFRTDGPDFVNKVHAASIDVQWWRPGPAGEPARLTITPGAAPVLNPQWSQHPYERPMAYTMDAAKAIECTQDLARAINDGSLVGNGAPCLQRYTAVVQTFPGSAPGHAVIGRLLAYRYLRRVLDEVRRRCHGGLSTPGACRDCAGRLHGFGAVTRVLALVQAVQPTVEHHDLMQYINVRFMYMFSESPDTCHRQEYFPIPEAQLAGLQPMYTPRAAGVMAVLFERANRNFTHTTMPARMDGLRGFVLEDSRLDLKLCSLHEAWGHFEDVLRQEGGERSDMQH